jgi:hypothetical protein
VLGGISGQNTAFIQGEDEMVQQTNSAQAGAAFDAARFSSSR